MNTFHYQNNDLYIENIRLTEIAAQYGSPCYVYSRTQIEKNWRAFDESLADYPHRICYAVKANSSLAILQVLAKLQSGFDIVSVGELERVLLAGGDPKKIVFSGVGKQIVEMQRALQVGIFCFNIESEGELERLNSVAQTMQKIAPIALRINPNIDAGTHPYIATGLHDNKFGIEMSAINALCEKIKTLSHVKLIGIGCHIGSQLTEVAPFIEALDCLLPLVDQFAAVGMPLQHIDIGGGLGITYQQETPPTIEQYGAALRKRLAKHTIAIVLEPGRAIVANAGILLTRVEYLKETPYKNFAIIDAAMNDLMRPALYEAWQNIIPVTLQPTLTQKTYDVVGPVCETGDFLGKERPLAINAGDLLAICDTGAYGFSMSSNYNTRPRVAEVLVSDEKSVLIGKRETLKDVLAREVLL